MERERWIGAKLKRTMTNEFGTFLLPENKVLDEEDLDMLAKHNVVLTERDVYWEKEKKTERKVKSREQEKLNLKRLIEETTEQVREVFDHVRYQNKIPLQEVRSEVIPSIQQAAENRNLFNCLRNCRRKMIIRTDIISGWG